jgi:geranylgeranylglycerol-phosphate geranylgeranyltransferase
MNAASNAINQIYDLEIDRLNKPKRPLVTGELSLREAWEFTWVFYALALIPTWLVVVYPYDTGSAEKLFAPLPYHQTFFIYLAGMVFTFVYSAPSWAGPRRAGWLANLTIAIPRGVLLKVAGWAMVAHVWHTEPWFIGAIFMLFLSAPPRPRTSPTSRATAPAAAARCRSSYGVERAAWMISPFFVLPWLLIPLGAFVPDPQNPEPPDPHRRPLAAHRPRRRAHPLGRLHRLPAAARPRPRWRPPRTTPRGATCT